MEQHPDVRDSSATTHGGGGRTCVVSFPRASECPRRTQRVFHSSAEGQRARSLRSTARRTWSALEQNSGAYVIGRSNRRCCGYAQTHRCVRLGPPACDHGLGHSSATSVTISATCGQARCYAPSRERSTAVAASNASALLRSHSSARPWCAGCVACRTASRSAMNR
jgi:hypothetical protein